MSGSSDGAVFITGATEDLGGAVLARFLECTGRRIYLLVRDGDQPAGARVRSVMGRLYDNYDEYAGRLHVVAGDIRRANLGLSDRVLDMIAEEVTAIVHAAATRRLDLSLKGAQDVNVKGTGRMLRLAGRCNRRGSPLAVFAHISTAFVAGKTGTLFRERDRPRGPWRNLYEESKAQAELLVGAPWLFAGAADLQTIILRPSIIVGESGSGWTTRWNGIYPYLAMILGGVLKEIAADPDATLDIVPLDYVAESIFAACERPWIERYHLVAAEKAPTIRAFVELLNERFGCSVRLVPPERWDPALEEVAPYLVLGPRFDDAATRAALLTPGPPSLHTYIDRLVAYARQASFGATPMSRLRARQLAL